MLKMCIDCAVHSKLALARERIYVCAALAHFTSARHRLARASNTATLNVLFRK
jgi:hypothetical protein